MATVQEIQNAIESGMKDYTFIKQYGGCGRAYVILCGADRTTKLRVRKGTKAAGRRYMGADGGQMANSIYVGYDNADSVAWSQAEQIAKNLQAIGISCYADGMND